MIDPCAVARDLAIVTHGPVPTQCEYVEFGKERSVTGRANRANPKRQLAVQGAAGNTPPKGFFAIEGNVKNCVDQLQKMVWDKGIVDLIDKDSIRGWTEVEIKLADAIAKGQKMISFQELGFEVRESAVKIAK